MTIKAQLADRKKTFAYAPKTKEFKFAMPAMPAMPAIPAMPAMPDIDVPVSVVVVHSSTRSGLMVENLTPQLGDFFGARNGQGVLVRSVEKGSRAEKAGFRAGDVIVRVNGEGINDTGDFSHALHGRKESTVNVNIIRDKKEQTLTLTLPDRKQSELLDENFEVPEIDAETRIDLSELRSRLKDMQPTIELAVREARRVREEARKAVRQQREELRQQQEELREQQRELQKEMIEEQRELRDELRIGLQGLSEI
jgi:membrane-associated protease RseP (regulator of RpoE activity)